MNEQKLHEEYKFEISFEKYKKILSELIKRQEEELKVYREKLEKGNVLEKQLYSYAVNQLEKSIVSNKTLLEISEKQKDICIFYVTQSGFPIKYYIGKTLKKEHELKNKYIESLYS